ncbi:MAG: ThuA domain-containing protein [Verrucomicrobia bacterium]|nr:ThuA domain-containing protein [Verrucomicrobiota bacterium]
MKRREMLMSTSAALLSLASFPLGWAVGAEPKRKKVLYFTRSAGFEHSVVHRTAGELSHSEKVLTDLGKWAGFEVECTQDGTVFDGDLDSFGAIAFYTSGDLTAPQGNGKPMTPAGKQKLLEAIAGGKGFVAFHSATDSFRPTGQADQGHTEVDPYIAMLGGEFVTHGPEQEASLVIASLFPGTDRLGCAEGLSFTDEWYAQRNFAKDLHVILVQETGLMTGACYRRPDYPNTWARRHGQGRVFYTALGHREEVWTNPFFQAIVLGGIAWALGNVQAKAEPNFDQVTPHANQLQS